MEKAIRFGRIVFLAEKVVFVRTAERQLVIGKGLEEVFDEVQFWLQ